MSTYDELHQKQLPELLQQLALASVGSIQGQDKVQFIQNLIAVRTAEMVNKQLAATADTVGRSANTIKSTLDHATEFMIAALKVNTEAGSASAESIKVQIAGLTSNLALASADIKVAGEQSAGISRRLNWLTGALVFAAILTAAATVFQAVETKRQADLFERQSHTTVTVPTPAQPPPGNTNADKQQ